MNPLMIFALANLKGDLGKLWLWLCHRSFWQLACMGLAAFALLQHFQLADARHDRDAYRRERDGYKATLDGLAKQSKERQKQVGQVIDHYHTVVVPKIEKQVERIETAPLPGNCRTPKEIMGADL